MLIHGGFRFVPSHPQKTSPWFNLLKSHTVSVSLPWNPHDVRKTSPSSKAWTSMLKSPLQTKKNLGLVQPSPRKKPYFGPRKNPFQPWGSNLEGLTSGCTWSAWEASHGTALCGAGWAERLTLTPDANSNINMVYIYIWFIYDLYMVYI